MGYPDKARVEFKAVLLYPTWDAVTALSVVQMTRVWVVQKRTTMKRQIVSIGNGQQTNKKELDRQHIGRENVAKT